MDVEVVLFRLAVAAALGLAMGYERELHGRSAGLRTNMIVTVSSCLLMIISIEFRDINMAWTDKSIIRLDPSRVASYAVAGMGFLGAGAIIHGRGTVLGLTTAAGLWAGNAVGLSVGAGFILPAVAGTAFVLFALIILHPIARFISKDMYMRLYLDFDTCGDRVAELNQILREFKAKVLFTGFECRFDSAVSSYEVAIRLKSKDDWSGLIQAIRRLEGLTRVRWAEGFVP